jgi:HK97 family phage portal protein
LSFVGRIKEFLIRNLSLSDPKAWNPSLWNLYGSQSLAGETVTEQTALTYSAVYNAISLISGTIGALPLHLMQRKGEAKRLADDRVMYGVMHDAANPYMTAMAFRECLMAHVLAWGNGYAEIIRNGYGELIQLWPITPNRVTPVIVEGALKYRIRMPGGSDLFLDREIILHVPGLGFDGFLGYSVVAMARRSIGLGMAMETFGSRFFGEGTHPGIIVEHPSKLSAEAHSNLKASLTETYSGLGNSHRLMLLEEGMKFQKIVIDPKDSQFLESRQFNIPEIARWFNLPPHKLKDLTKSSFSNIESEQISFVTDSILPWLVRLEQVFNMQLLSEGDRGYYGRGRLYFKHNIEGLLRADSAARGAYYREMFNIGAMSINEIREKEDMDPIPGGDVHLVPLNMTTLENAGKPRELPGGDKTAPVGAPRKGNGQDQDGAAGQVSRRQ